MAQYATLKAAIDAVIKANGQKEITGTVLNEVLTSMVNSLGANYMLAGVATPSTNPGTPDQNVFYLAFEAGTYTNFNATVLPAGISILMWNGSWLSQTFYTMDATPTASSNNLVSSGAVFDAIKTDGSAYDVSAHFPTGGPNSDGKFTLDYILANANTLIPAAWRKGGMSIRFVSSSDNNYVQARCMADEFTTDITQWAIANEGVYVENPEFVYVKVDAENKILWAIRTDGTIFYGAGVPPQIVNYINEKIAELSLDEYEDIVTFLSDYLGSDSTLMDIIGEWNNAVPGKKISILGDSISTFNQEGYKIDGYAMYYPTAAGDRGADVATVNDTWWMQVINSVAGTLEVNASYSGSTASSRTIGFSPRVPLLGNPDIIYVALGTNDSSNDVTIGEINFEAETYDLTQFAPAYIKGMQDTIAAYPKAKIVCVAFDMGEDYQNAIKTIAEHYGAEYIYVGDISAVHPNKAEMTAAANRIITSAKYTITDAIKTLSNEKVDKEDGKSLIDAEYASTKSTVDNPEFLKVTTDSEDKVLEGIQADGTKVIGGDLNVGGSANLDGDLRVLGNMEVSGVSYKVIESPEYLAAWVDTEGKVIFGLKADGKTYVGDADFLNNIKDNQEAIAEIKTTLATIGAKVDSLDIDALASITAVENPEYMEVELDADDKVLSGRKVDGTKFENNDVELNGNATVGGSLEVDGLVIKNIEDIEGRTEILTDAEGKIISYRKDDGTLVENVGIETTNTTTGSLSAKEVSIEGGEATLEKATLNSLELTEQGMTDFQQALKDSGFKPGGGGDYSDTITEKGKKPVFIPMPRLARLNINWDGNLTTLSKSDRPDGVQKVNYDVKVKCDFFDGQGVYFSKWALMSAQGNSSMGFIKKNISLKFFDTEDVEGKKKKWGKGDTFGTVFGDWVMQKTYHLKAFYTDFIRGSSEVAYQLADEVYKTRGVYADRPWKKALIDFSEITSVTPANLSEDWINDMNLQIDNGARCMPDGFPVIVYQNGDFYGIYVWMLKKDADNFNMDTANVNHIHIDGNLYAGNLWGGNINWTAFEIRNPEDLVCMDGSDYDGDFPAELIDTTATGVYDPENEDHVRSAQVKQYIINLSNRVGQINSLTPTYTRQDDVVITLNDYKGIYDSSKSYGRGNYVLDQQDGNTYYMSLHSSNAGHTLADTDYWHDVTEDIITVKTEFEKYFDIDNLVDYQLINMACGDTDGFGKNWQWTTWDGVKWYVNQYDKDMSFGNMWTGMFTIAPRTGWVNNNINLPCGLAIRYYQAEHKARWQELVNAGIFNAEHIKSMITAWISRVGKNNFVQEWKKWTEAPCNRSSKIDFEYWKFTGGSINGAPTSGTIWDDSTPYSVGDKVWFKAFDGVWYLQFEAVKAGDNHPCLTDGYSVYPKSMGYRDSVWRFFKYIEETLANQNTFINNL